MSTTRILQQRNWTEAQLRAAGFEYFLKRKLLVMARELTHTRRIDVSLETLVAQPGDILCFDPGDKRRKSLNDYDHWPVRGDLFQSVYRPWDERNWQPNAAEQHLLKHGCRPYYKVSGVWARRLRRSMLIQSLESPHPVKVPAGYWLCIGSQGEPYHMSDRKFHERYVADLVQT